MGGKRLSLWQRLSPPQLFVGSFALLVVLGALGLKLLPGLYTGEPLSWIDALFTATSAVCVTGLIVVDTATHFTLRGQAFILLLIQLGGLGMIVFSSLIIVALGRRLSLRQEVLSAGSLELPNVRPRQLVLDAVRFTFGLEALGALLLYILWVPRFGWSGAAWPALFHSISAFCNAGFSSFSHSVVGFRDAPLSLAVMMMLIVAGGIGFLTLEELYLRYKAGRAGRAFRISLHSRIVLATTAVLLAAAWVLYGLFEWHSALGSLSVPERVLNALFMSVTCRTAGFNSVDYSAASESGNFLTIVLMSIGGSPGSTAGGIKTTTFALIGLVAWSRLRGYETTSVWSRSLREETIQRAIGLFVIAFAFLAAGIFLLTATEGGNGRPGGFLTRVFEAASAFNTVGLSMGLTPTLSAAGKWTVIALMFLGRVGPLTIAAALTMRRAGLEQFRYAYEDVAVG